MRWTALSGLVLLLLAVSISCASGDRQPGLLPTSGVGPSSTTVVPSPPTPTRTPLIQLPEETATDTIDVPPSLDFLDTRIAGDATVYFDGRDAYVLLVDDLTGVEPDKLDVGEALFLENWTPNTGLGPIFNSPACSSCHINNGRAAPPVDTELPANGLLLRFSIPGQEGYEPEPNYGDQLQDDALDDIPPEGRILITGMELTGEFADGTSYTLLNPVYEIVSTGYGALHPQVVISPRIAPSVYGLGLLEAITDETLLAMADPSDSDGDGISGRVNMVPSPLTGELEVGRFGWKANQSKISYQVAAAFADDLGITSAFARAESCTRSQSECNARAHIGRELDLALDRVKDVGLYVQVLAVPAMRNVDDPTVRRGAELFVSTGCSSCHVPTLKTGLSEIPALANQTIHPFTDLLLHDMGEGLADNRPDFEANGREWRTPPLWGIGLVEVVNGHTRFLHDGRARNLTEAILWHGGEAEKSRDLFKALSAAEREALITFLDSL